jgi:3,4-dihydroxy 2-butanone 4-phosphate synthase/GTP cyclohydrolase II
MTTASVDLAIAAMTQGQFVVVVDDESRENEGDLILAAEHASAAKLAFMIRHTSGIICVPMTEERIRALELPQMVHNNTEAHTTAFTVSVDYRHHTTTGISAADRTRTIQALADPQTRAEDFARPGHIFPLMARPGGVLRRAGHTEAAVDLARLAGLAPVGVICELVNDDGSIKRLPELRAFAAEHQLPVLSIVDLIRYRRRKEKLVECRQRKTLATPYGAFTAYTYLSLPDGLEHLVLVKGEVDDGSDVLVRVHNERLLDDMLAAPEDNTVQAALRRIAETGKGVLVYLRDPHGVSLNYRDKSPPPVTTDTPEQVREWRENGVGSQILVDLGVQRMRLLVNSNWHYTGLESYGLTIVESLPMMRDQTSNR